MGKEFSEDNSKLIYKICILQQFMQYVSEVLRIFYY